MISKKVIASKVKGHIRKIQRSYLLVVIVFMRQGRLDDGQYVW